MESCHHPFTAPSSNILNEKDLASVRGQHYDLVVNGSEIGGGSIRIHSANLQKEVFSILGLSASQISDFSHLLDAFRFGCPPHGGIALGLDRLLAIICQASSIRDVIAFPKSNIGNDLMCSSPSEVSSERLAEYFIKTEAPKL